MEFAQKQSLLRRRWPILALIATCLVVHAHTIGFDFVFYDDQIHILDNPYVAPPTWNGLVRLWHAPYEQLYIPLSYTLFAGLCVIAKLPPHVLISDTGSPYNPHLFHVASVVMHTCNVLLVYALLIRIVRRQVPATFGALLFAVHPFQVESVAWISEMRGLLASLLSLASILIYVSARKDDGSVRNASYGFALALFVCALLSKPAAVVAPLLAIPIDMLIARRTVRQYALQLGPWLVISLVLVLVTRSAQPVDASVIVSPLLRPFIGGDALAFYVTKLLVPIQLSTDYSRRPDLVLQHWYGYSTSILPIAIAIGCWVVRKSYPWIAAAAIISVLALLPVLGLVPFTFQRTSTVADRYMYLAMLGPAILVACAMANAKLRHLALASAWLILLSGATLWRSEAWRNTDALWARELITHPRGPLINLGIGHAYLRKNDFAAAIPYLRTAIANRVGYVDAYFDLGSALEGLGKLDEADEAYRKALEYDPTYAKAQMNLGNTQLTRGNVVAAMSAYEAARKIDPNLVRLNYNVGNALMAAGKNDEALAAFQREITSNQDFAPSYVNAAIILANANRLQEAADMMTKAISVATPKAAWYSNLAYIHGRMGKLDDARREAAEALRIDPKDEAAAYILRSLTK